MNAAADQLQNDNGLSPLATHTEGQRRHAVRHANTRNLIKEGKREREREEGRREGRSEAVYFTSSLPSPAAAAAARAKLATISTLGDVLDVSTLTNVILN